VSSLLGSTFCTVTFRSKLAIGVLLPTLFDCGGIDLTNLGSRSIKLDFASSSLCLFRPERVPKTDLNASRLICDSRHQPLESMRRAERALFSGSRGVSFPQLNKGNQTQFDPPVIPTGRRLKTSACLRFYAVFSWVCTHRPSLKLSPARCLSKHTRELAWVLFLPLATRLSGVSKSRDPEVIEKSRTS
jgi:hypothetical protein